MRKSLLLLAAAAALPTALSAQTLKEGYITWPESNALADYVKQWNGGSGKITVKGEAWEDQEFFTSRVKPRARFQNTKTQVYPDRVAYDVTTKTGTDKRLCYWVPINDNVVDGVTWNALPNGKFDQEVFAMWNYVDHYGNWTCPWGWTPGAFADVAHKNGVAVSGVASVPYGGISSSWNASFVAMQSVKAEDLGKFLYYFGQDGLGYNSEFSSAGSIVTNLMSLHEGLQTYMASRNPLWEVMWYAGTNDGASITFDRGLDGFTGLFKSASMFLNYNWNNQSYMSSAISTAQGMNRDPFLLYAGMNMQGGEPKYGENYPILKNYQYSIGLWGAHQVNMLWQDRQAKGSDQMVKQLTYATSNERLFTNGAQNPAVKMEIKTNRSHRPSDDWAGYSSMMNARSTLKWDLGQEPFVTYFNLGNGQFMNWMGERMNNKEWYNIGVQDYLPTWRWWFAPEWLQNSVNAGDAKLKAQFTWEDAYVGGSCLKISGTSAKEYLHLFKTEFDNIRSKTITIRYKLLRGKANARLVFTSAQAPETFPTTNVIKNMTFLNAEDAITAQDQSYKVGADGWITKTFKAPINANSAMGGGLGLIGIEFIDADDMEMLIGELSIIGTASSKPAAPKLKSAKVLANQFSGVDGKLFWTMDDDVALNTGTPKYNSDVNTSMFKVYAQQKGGNEQLVGLTTSWAAFVFQADVDQSAEQQIRFGVSAVSIDTKSESAITWSDYMELPAYQKVSDITINKSIIKPNEKFTLGFVDDQMPSATWTIKNAVTGNQVWEGNGKSVEVPGIDEIGSYDLIVTYDDGSRASVSREFPRYVVITSETVGALPEIYSLAIDGTTVDENSSDISINLNNESGKKKFSYTGRPADGTTSRGLDINEKWFGVRVGDLHISDYTSYSIAAWVRLSDLPAGYSNFFTIEDRIGGGWPFNNWGYFYSRINENGGFTGEPGVDGIWGGRSTQRDSEGYRWWYYYGDSKIEPNSWAHVVLVFEYNEDGQFRQHFYINGKKQKVNSWINASKARVEGVYAGTNWDLKLIHDKLNSGDVIGYGEDTYEPEFTSTADWPLSAEMWISFGGTSQNISAVKGSLDDFQIWGKAMTADDVAASMAGLDKNNMPADVLAYWDFEDDPAADYGFVGVTGANAVNKAPKAYWYDVPSEGENSNTRAVREPSYLSGCPFIAGTGYPIVTKPTWSTRGDVKGDGTGTEGEAEINFTRQNDYTVDLTLENGHGKATASYPVISVVGTTAIDGIAADENGEVKTYVISDALFVDFAEAGAYNVAVYNTAGMLQAQKQLNAAAGQTATIALGTPGIYLVKIAKDGRELRTVKVVRK